MTSSVVPTSAKIRTIVLSSALARVDLAHDRPARQAGAVPSRAHPPVDLGRDHDLLAAGEILQRAAEDLRLPRG
jgi:hypothetical protein